MAEPAEPDISKLLASANAALNDVNASDFNDPSMRFDDANAADDVQLTADDLNDPDLLAQLADFGDSSNDDDNNSTHSSGDDEKLFEDIKHKSLQKLQQSLSQLSSKTNLSQPNIAPHVKELQTLISDIQDMDAIEFVTSKDELESEGTQLLSKIQSILSTVNKHQNSRYATNSPNPNITSSTTANESTLLKRYKEYRLAAKKSKDEGDTKQAVLYLRQSKTVKALIEQLRGGLPVASSDVPIPLQPSTYSSQPQKPSQTSPTPSESIYASIDVIKGRAATFRSACLSAKKAGNMELAKEYLGEMKELQKMIPFIASGQIRPKTLDLPAPRALTAQQDMAYAKLIKFLKAQIADCGSSAETKAYAKQFEAQLAKVVACQKRVLSPVPSFDKFTVRVKKINMNVDVNEDEFRMSVSTLSKVDSLVKGSAEVYVKLSCEPLGVEYVSSAKKVQKGGCVINVCKRYRIDRGNVKKLKHKMQFGKLQVALFQKKMFGDVCVGEGVLKLKLLLDKAVLNEAVQVRHEKDRKRNALLDVEIKLRTPVVAESFVMVDKTLIKISKYPEAKEPVRINYTPLVASGGVAKEKEVVAMVGSGGGTGGGKAFVKVDAVMDNGLVEGMIENPLDAEYIESFECMSAEIEACQKAIEQRQGRKCDGLQDRLQALMTNRNILQVQVTNGILTVDQYTEKVKKAMVTDLKLAKYLKSKGRAQEAAKVFQRYKIMKQETQGPS